MTTTANQKLSDDEVIAIRDALTAIGLEHRTVLQNNALRDCDIALRVVRCKPETSEQARTRVGRYSLVADFLVSKITAKKKSIQSKPREEYQGALRVWWIPQVPCKAFRVSVASREQAEFLLTTLAKYDLFQYENHIKPDYCNTGGLEVFEGGEWVEWSNEDGDRIDDVMGAK